MNIYDILVKLGATHGNASKYAPHMQNMFREAGITTELRKSMFLAQVYHESARLRVIEENLNYSAAALRRVFNRHFPNDAIANQYARNPKAIANRAYGNRMGNGDESSGDGWRFRGRGLIQLTGRNNYTAASRDLGVDIVRNPDYLLTPEGAVRSAGWFWSVNNLNATADRGDIRGNTRIINGGFNGLADRQKYYALARELFDVGQGKKKPSDTNLILRIGARGPTVRAMQEKLGIKADGIFGPQTEAAVKRYQSANGLRVDGIAGPQTLGLLFG